MKVDANYVFLRICCNLWKMMIDRGMNSISMDGELEGLVGQARSLVQKIEDGVLELNATSYRHLAQRLRKRVNEVEQVFLRCNQPQRGGKPLCILLFTDKMGVKVVQQLNSFIEANGEHDFVLVAKTGATACAKKSLISVENYIEIFTVNFISNSHPFFR